MLELTPELPLLPTAVEPAPPAPIVTVILEPIVTAKPVAVSNPPAPPPPAFKVEALFANPPPPPPATHKYSTAVTG
jgi:hypothetical protein